MLRITVAFCAKYALCSFLRLAVYRAVLLCSL